MDEEVRLETQTQEAQKEGRQVSKLSLGGTSPEYGDKTVIDKFRTDTKPMPVSGAPAPKRGPGRPSGPSAPAPAAAPTEGGGALPGEHAGLMQQLAKAEQVADYWQQLSQVAPSTFTQMYAKRATEVRDRLALKLYRDTPNLF